jgi:hypothetical protein
MMVAIDAIDYYAMSARIMYVTNHLFYDSCQTIW